MKVDVQFAPLPLHLSVLGMPGLTAYFGLLDVGQPKAGDTVVLSRRGGGRRGRCRSDRQAQGLPRDRYCRRAGEMPFYRRRAWL